MEHPKNIINLNDYALVDLTHEGEMVWEKYWGHEIPESAVESRIQPDGRFKFQLWELAHIFGQSLFIGNPNLFKDNSVEIIRS